MTTPVPSGDSPFGATQLTPEEQRRRLSGICCYNWLGLTSLAAFLCGVFSFAYCDFLSRSIILSDDYTPGDYETACSDLYGSADYLNVQVCQSLMNSHKIGFNYWQATVPVDQKVCFTYEQLTPWGYASPEFDTEFYASRAFAIIGYVFGGIAWFTLLCSSCLKVDQQRLKGIGCYFIIASFSQGLSLMMLNSRVCEKGFFEPYFVPPDSNTTSLNLFNGVVEDVECTMSNGSKLAISATVLYFVCAMMVPLSVVPFYEERHYQSQYQSVQQEQAPGPASSPSPAPSPPLPPGEGPVVQGHVTGNV